MKNLVKGLEMDASNHQVIEVTNPATGEFIDTVPNSTEEDVDMAVQAAIVAQKAWAAMPLHERGRILEKFVDLVERDKEELAELLNQEDKTKTEIAIEVMLWIMRRQMFIDGNKRVGMLFANKIMIDNGCGIITIAQADQPTFFEKLIKFYETGDNTDLKQWIYETSIDGINLNT